MLQLALRVLPRSAREKTVTTTFFLSRPISLCLQQSTVDKKIEEASVAVVEKEFEKEFVMYVYVYRIRERIRYICIYILERIRHFVAVVEKEFENSNS